MIEAAVDVVAVDAVGVQVEDSVSVVEEADVAVDVEEAAEVLKVHPNTVIRDWRLAKAWLKLRVFPAGS